MVAGLETISGGEVQIGGQRANDKEPMDRDIAMVFQNYALYPHMSVRQNMGYGLKIAKLSKDQIEAKVVAAGVGPDGPVKLSVRPEHLLVQDDGAIRVQVRMAEPLGANTLLHGAVDGVSGNFTASLQGVHLMDQPSKELRFAFSRTRHICSMWIPACAA
jgi:ABC-type sugar transport system ATPase subunit